jgi:hypothetical protein
MVVFKITKLQLTIILLQSLSVEAERVLVLKQLLVFLLQLSTHNSACILVTVSHASLYLNYIFVELLNAIRGGNSNFQLEPIRSVSH